MLDPGYEADMYIPQPRYSVERLACNQVEMECFYERLVLLSLLSPTQGSRRTPRRRAWHRFLDDLCCLCDTHPGGRTVVSIAAEEGVSCLRFWIAANNHLKQAYEHLKWVLENLSKLDASSSQAVETVERCILERFVNCSRRKIRNYTAWLRINVQGAERTQQSQSPEGWSVC